jgi:hypothetical protein
MHRQAALVGPGNANGVTSAVTTVRMVHRTNNLAILMYLMSCPALLSGGLLRCSYTTSRVPVVNADDDIILALRKAG